MAGPGRTASTSSCRVVGGHRIASPGVVERPEPGTFLALLSDGDREALLQRGGPRRFARGEGVMYAGEPGDRVLILLSVARWS
jgi:hypothetical protein